MRGKSVKTCNRENASSDEEELNRHTKIFLILLRSGLPVSTTSIPTDREFIHGGHIV